MTRAMVDKIDDRIGLNIRKKYTEYQARYFAEQLMLKRPLSSMESLASAMSGVKVDMNPHQVDAALFAMKSPLSTGVILADEVGLGKTIEAGLVLAQYWSERKRRILLITPASIRMQWRSELKEKFFIDSTILELKEYKKLKSGVRENPFLADNEAVICSYHFAAQHADDLQAVEWDLVVFDEAHRLRNVFKKGNMIASKLKQALSGRKKLLLTATPLQNNLMELYGLVSIIDEHVFGDPKTFRGMYVSASNSHERDESLRERLRPFCKRTLRKQVSEYIRYTNRIAMCQSYDPTEKEEELYNGISTYLQSGERLYALPNSQRKLTTMILRKLLASSSFAISRTLDSLVCRLEQLLQGTESSPDLSDYDVYEEMEEETDGFEEDTLDREAVEKELALLRQFAALAKSIKFNAKGENLIEALEQGFDKMDELGGERKAVIFTESRRTQEYVYKLLTNRGYEGKIVFLNGNNDDPVSKNIYADWLKRHKDDDCISGSKQADIKAAIVEEFKNNASILIGTEAAAEGINLQFCSIVVNYDLPWNPQRIEQRIGRCHRYGQKNDVVVINFLNRKNAADVRVYELLDEKFKLFSGVFGSSDEVLGTIESGVDFEKRIAEIYQKCKSPEEYQKEFDQLQAEMAEQINEKMLQTRQSVLENLDESVANRLKQCQEDTVSSLSKYNQWMHYFLLSQGVEYLSDAVGKYRIMKDGIPRIYSLNWRDAEERSEHYLRRDDKLVNDWLQSATSNTLSPAHLLINCDNSHSSFIKNNKGSSGIITVDKLACSGLDNEEHLVFSACFDDGTEIDDEMVDSILSHPAHVEGTLRSSAKSTMESLREMHIAARQDLISETHKKFYLEECDKIDAYSEDLKEGLQREITELKKTLKEKKKEFRSSSHLPMAQLVSMKSDINAIEKKIKTLQRERDEKEDEIDRKSEQLQRDIEKRLKSKYEISSVITISFQLN